MRTSKWVIICVEVTSRVEKISHTATLYEQDLTLTVSRLIRVNTCSVGTGMSSGGQGRAVAAAQTPGQITFTNLGKQ